MVAVFSIYHSYRKTFFMPKGLVVVDRLVRCTLSPSGKKINTILWIISRVKCSPISVCLQINSLLRSQISTDGCSSNCCCWCSLCPQASQGSDCLSVQYLQCVCARRSRFFTWWSLGVVKLLHILLEVYLLIETRQRSSAWAVLVENTNRTKSVFVLSSLKHSEQDKVDG